VVLEPPHDIDQQYLNQYVKSFAGGSNSRLVLVGRGDQRGRVASGTGRKRVPRKTREKGKALVITERGHLSKAGADHQQSAVESKEPADLNIVVGKSQDFDPETEERAAIRMKLVNIEGTLFLESDVPWSSLFGVVPGVTGGNPMMGLEPVV
jgi:hypothetical protein